MSGRDSKNFELFIPKRFELSCAETVMS